MLCNGVVRWKSWCFVEQDFGQGSGTKVGWKWIGRTVDARLSAVLSLTMDGRTKLDDGEGLVVDGDVKVEGRRNYLQNDDLLSEKQQPRCSKLANKVVCLHVMAWMPRFWDATAAWLHLQRQCKEKPS